MAAANPLSLLHNPNYMVRLSAKGVHSVRQRPKPAGSEADITGTNGYRDPRLGNHGIPDFSAMPNVSEPYHQVKQTGRGQRLDTWIYRKRAHGTSLLKSTKEREKEEEEMTRYKAHHALKRTTNPAARIHPKHKNAADHVRRRGGTNTFLSVEGPREQEFHHGLTQHLPQQQSVNMVQGDAALHLANRDYQQQGSSRLHDLPPTDVLEKDEHRSTLTRAIHAPSTRQARDIAPDQRDRGAVEQEPQTHALGLRQGMMRSRDDEARRDAETVQLAHVHTTALARTLDPALVPGGNGAPVTDLADGKGVVMHDTHGRTELHWTGEYHSNKGRADASRDEPHPAAFLHGMNTLIVAPRPATEVLSEPRHATKGAMGRSVGLPDNEQAQALGRTLGHMAPEQVGSVNEGPFAVAQALDMRSRPTVEAQYNYNARDPEWQNGVKSEVDYVTGAAFADQGTHHAVHETSGNLQDIDLSQPGRYRGTNKLQVPIIGAMLVGVARPGVVNQYYSSNPEVEMDLKRNNADRVPQLLPHGIQRTGDVGTGQAAVKRLHTLACIDGGVSVPRHRFLHTNQLQQAYVATEGQSGRTADHQHVTDTRSVNLQEGIMLPAPSLAALQQPVGSAMAHAQRQAHSVPQTGLPGGMKEPSIVSGRHCAPVHSLGRQKAKEVTLQGQGYRPTQRDIPWHRTGAAVLASGGTGPLANVPNAVRRSGTPITTMLASVREARASTPSLASRGDHNFRL